MSTPEIDRFVDIARGYCEFVETDAAQMATETEKLEAARMILLALYSSALTLPEIELDEVEELPEPPDAVEAWPSLAYDQYWLTLNPLETDKETEVGLGSLDDDILAIYQAVKAGLLGWDAGQQAMAVWQWQLDFRMNWGSQAMNALVVLHHACSDDDDDESESDDESGSDDESESDDDSESGDDSAS